MRSDHERLADILEAIENDLSPLKLQIEKAHKRQ